MNNANRVIVNSIILNIRIIVTTLISLVSVPLVMHTLGSSDYGLYSLIGGVIGLLAFLKSSMTVSTQRFISVAMGENDLIRINTIYNNSIILHYIIGIGLVIILEIVYPFLFSGFLNVEADRIWAAKIIYQFLVATIFLDITSVPFIGVINAKENMLVFSVVGIIESLMKLILAFSLPYFSGDLLVIYGVGIFVIAFLIRLVYYLYVKYHYCEYHVSIRCYADRRILSMMTGFTGWNTFGALALVGRNQGIAIVINLFFNTVVNAAYGIANQINGVMGHVSHTFQKSINPQLMKSFGMDDQNRLIRLSYKSSKFSVLIFAMFSVPLIIEMEYILKLWLGIPPQYTIRFSQLVLILSLLNQFSMGLMSSIQATGHIRTYQITVSILILLNIPITYILFSLGVPPYGCVISFILIEFVSFVYRIFMAKKIVGISPKSFVDSVLRPVVLCVLVATCASFLIHMLLQESFLRVALVFIIYIILFSVCVWKLSMDSRERIIFQEFTKKITNIYPKKFNYVRKG